MAGQRPDPPVVDTETLLRRACYERLADDAAWAALADWLRDHGRDRQADDVPNLRRSLVRLLPVALPVAEFAPPRDG